MLVVLIAIGVALGGAASPAVAYDEGTIVALANEARAANGQGGLVHNGALDAVAFGWAQQLAVNGTLGHNPSVAQQVPGGWSRVGENVAQGYGSGAAVHDGWMNSPGHRGNILGDYTDIGVAMIEGGGTTWAVQVFAKYAGSGLPPPAPPAPAPAPAPPAPAPAPPAPAPPAPPAPAEPAPVESAPAASEAAAPAPATTTEPEPVTSAPVKPSADASSAASSSPSLGEAAPTDAEAAALLAGSAGTPWWPWVAAALAAAAVVAALLIGRARRRD